MKHVKLFEEFIYESSFMENYFESYLNEAKERFYVTDGKGNFLTRKSLSADYSFTDNHNFAYTFDTENEAQSVANGIKKYPAFKDLNIQVTNKKDAE